MNLAEAARAVVEELRASNHGRSIRFEADDATDGTWDPDRLAQVCSNLICNALEHGRPGDHVEVRVERTDRDTARLIVENDGKTLTAETLSQLFLPFRRGTATASGGVGLGLYIVHQVVTAHGGTVTATSVAGRTRFCVELPMNA